MYSQYHFSTQKSSLFRFRESFRENFLFGMRILIQELTECVSVSRSETLVDVTKIRYHLKKFLFWRKASGAQNVLQSIGENDNLKRKPSLQQNFPKTFLKTKIFAKINAKAKIFAKRYFAKSERIFAYFRFSRK
jgi:hypothetical protein